MTDAPTKSDPLSPCSVIGSYSVAPIASSVFTVA